MAGLRYSSASAVIAGLSGLYKKSRKEVYAIVSTPFASEGNNAQANSARAIQFLNNNNIRIISFSCEELLQANGDKFLIKDLDGKFEKMILTTL